jgi:hypothetical protein
MALYIQCNVHSRQKSPVLGSHIFFRSEKWMIWLEPDWVPNIPNIRIKFRPEISQSVVAIGLTDCLEVTYLLPLFLVTCYFLVQYYSKQVDPNPQPGFPVG